MKKLKPHEMEFITRYLLELGADPVPHSVYCRSEVSEWRTNLKKKTIDFFAKAWGGEQTAQIIPEVLEQYRRQSNGVI